MTGTSDDLGTIRQALTRLKLRLAGDEINEETYDRLVERVCAGLPAEERVRLGLTPTPVPVTPGPSPHPSPRVGPSGVDTLVPKLSDLKLEPGSELLGQWRITRELGRGGFGAVFAAEELKLEEVQAVKVLDPAMVAQAELLARFRREVKLMRRLRHPHIVQVFDYR